MRNSSWLYFVTWIVSLSWTAGRDVSESYQERAEVEIDVTTATKTHYNACFLTSLSSDLWNDVSFAVHRSGEPEPCAITTPVSLSDMEKALLAMDVCDGEEIGKFEVETFLTTYLMTALTGTTCGSTDNETAPAGLQGWCDMGPERTVHQPDSDDLIQVPTTQSWPCRWYTREGLRIDSLQRLANLAENAKKAARDCQEESCVIPTLHIYGVPAGRVFMFAPSRIGDTFVLNHIQDVHGNAIQVECINMEPRLFEVYNFFTPEEADQLIDRALTETSETHKLHRSTTGAVEGSIYNKRTSENAWNTHSPEALAIKRRCMTTLGFDEYWESHTDGLQVLRYQNGQAYVPHADYLDDDKKENYNYNTATVGGNRFATILLYLTDLAEKDGGETVFTEGWPADATEEQMKIPLKETIRQLRQGGEIDLLKPGSWEEEMTAHCRTKLAIRPRKGRAVLFYSQHPNGQEDVSVKHGGCPVLNGTKWAANLWSWSAARNGPDSPLRDPTLPEEPAPQSLHATFINTGQDPLLDDAELFYEEETSFGKLTPKGPGVAVNTYEGHIWNIKANGNIFKSIVITGEPKQTYNV